MIDNRGGNCASRSSVRDYLAAWLDVKLQGASRGLRLRQNSVWYQCSIGRAWRPPFPRNPRQSTISTATLSASWPNSRHSKLDRLIRRLPRSQSFRMRPGNPS